MKRKGLASGCLAILCAAGAVRVGSAADQPQWGQRYSRNMVSRERGLPDWFDPGERDGQGNIDPSSTANVKWVVRLGNMTYSTPVVAEGKIFVGSDNDVPRDPRIQGDRGVMMCLDEAAGEFLWQLNVPKMNEEIKYSDWHHCGITSSPAVEDGKAYLVTNRCEVACLDLQGMADGNDGPYRDEGRHMVPKGAAPMEPGAKDADVLWLYDMVAELGVRPHNASNCSVLIHGDLLYVCTSNGVDWTHHYVMNPEAPSLIMLEKHTGRLVGRDDFGIGGDVVHGQWSSPSTGQVGGRWLGYFGAGNGFLYAFEMLDPQSVSNPPVSLRPVWKLHGHPLAQTQDHVPPDHQHDSTSYEVTAMPVFHDGRVYVAFTQEPFHNMKEAWLLCIDATGTGDVTRSGIVWSYDGIGACVSTVSVDRGLLYVADFLGRLHCLDAETGRPHWVHNAGSRIAASTMVADGKVYLGTGSQVFWVLAAGKQLKVISRIRMRDPIYATATAANGVLYVATRRHLYAVGE